MPRVVSSCLDQLARARPVNMPLRWRPCHCMHVCLGRWRKRVSFAFSLSKCIQRDSKRKRQRGSQAAVGVRLCLCVELNTCVSVTDWLAARFHRLSAVASPEIARQSGRISYYFPALACSLVPSHAAGRPHSPLDAKHTPLYPLDILAMLPLRELWLACLPPGCTHE